ncbi:nuclear transport factor 2 family protein [Siansivirga zeaxanthinifaciens]|nr:nuclear transport factor 2 family protein [Siansivirga zeaxanthinifaciens]
MKSVKIILLVLFIFCNKGFAQDVSLDILKKEVLKSQASRISAMIDADINKLKNLLADDLTYAHTTGWTETKLGYLETIKSKRIHYISFVPRDVDVKIYGNTAILSGKVDVNLGRTDFTIRFLEVQCKLDGIWKLTAWQSVLNKVD